MIADLKPAFFRFPGGCIVHAGSYKPDAPYRVYRWKDTLGDVAERPVSASMWAGNNQSFGLGFYEYFVFAEEIGATPIPHVTAGIDPMRFRESEAAGILFPYIKCRNGLTMLLI